MVHALKLKPSYFLTKCLNSNKLFQKKSFFNVRFAGHLNITNKRTIFVSRAACLRPWIKNYSPPKIRPFNVLVNMLIVSRPTMSQHFPQHPSLYVIITRSFGLCFELFIVSLTEHQDRCSAKSFSLTTKVILTSALI